MADIEDFEEQTRRMIDQMVEKARVGEIGIEADIKNYLQTTRMGKVLKGTTEAAGKLTKGFTQSIKSMGTSKGSFEDLTGAVNLTIGAVSGLLSAIPVVGTAFSKLGDVAAEAATFAIGQVQKNYTAFQELAKAGQIGADGVVGMAKQFEEAGMPLAIYSKLLTKNSENLAYFSTSAIKGGKDFSAVIRDMDKPSKQFMRNLGYSIEEIGESAIEYQALQRRRGILDQMSQDQLAKGTASYVKELDSVAKLTGIQVSELKKQRDEVRADSRFRARLIKIRADGNKEGAASMEMFAAMLNDMNPELRKGFSDITSGAINTEAALKMTRSGMLGTMTDIQAGLESGKMNHAEALNLIIGTSKEISSAGGMIQGLAGVSDEAAAKFLDLAKTADMGNMSLKSMDDITKIQNKIKLKPDATTNKLNTSMAKLEVSIANVNKAFIATPLATDTIGIFSDALLGSINVIKQAFAPDKPIDDDDYFDDEDNFGISDDDGKPKSMTMWSDLIAWAKGDDAEEWKSSKDEMIANAKTKNSSQGFTMAEIAKGNTILDSLPEQRQQLSNNVVAAKPIRAQSRTRPKQLEADIATRETALSNARIDAAKGGITQKEMAGLDKMADTLVSMQKQLIILNDKTDKANVGRDKQTKTIANR